MPSTSASPPAPNRRARHAIGTQYKLDHSLIDQTASRRGHSPLPKFRKSLRNRTFEEDRRGQVVRHGQFLFRPLHAGLIQVNPSDAYSARARANGGQARI